MLRNVIANSRRYRLILQFMSELDKKDRQILRELSLDGRISNLDLAEKVALSPSACLRRVSALKAQGIITGYTVRTDRAALGIGFVAYVTVGLGQHTKAAQEAFDRAMGAADEVVECHNITGSVEYLLRVEAQDLRAYKRFHTETLGALPQVATITTFVVMASPKDRV